MIEELEYNNNNNNNNNILTKDACVQVIIDNGWNNYKIKQLKKRGEELKIYQYLHKDASTYYKKLHQKLFLPQTSIMTIATGTLFISLSDKIGDNGRYWINVFVSFLTLIGSVLSVWVKFFNAEQQSNDHLNASKNYSLIVDNIEEQIGLENDEKENYHDYMIKIRKMINEQKQLSLDIDQKFWNRYFKSVSRGELIVMNQTILDDQINREMNRLKKMSHTSTSFFPKNNNQNTELIINMSHNQSYNESNNENNNQTDINFNNNTDVTNNNDGNNDGINDSNNSSISDSNYDLNKITTDDLKRKFIYQLQRNL